MTTKQKLSFAFALGIVFSTMASAQTSDTLPDYVPLLPQVKAKAPKIDPKKGYFVQKLKPDVYMITESEVEGRTAVAGDDPQGLRDSR